MASSKTQTPLQTGLFSADSHVLEPVTAWEGVLPPDFWPPEGSTAGRWGERGGGMDPTKRREEMGDDGVIAEVLYPSRGLKVYSVEDVDVHESACRAYNEWLRDYCSVDPERLIGVGMIPAYDADKAIAEIRYCHDLGFKGVMLWQVPHPDLPFQDAHYEPIWAEMARLNLPLSFHILTGFKYSNSISANSGAVRTAGIPDEQSPAYQFQRVQRAVNLKVQAAMDMLAELVMTGVLERHPNLRVVIVENELGWIPFAASQWDFYATKKAVGQDGQGLAATILPKPPSEYFKDQIYATFFQDQTAKMIFSDWGNDTFMWSNDYPHPNSTWPNSRKYLEEHIGELPEKILEKVLRTNAERLYGKVPDLDK